MITNYYSQVYKQTKSKILIKLKTNRCDGRDNQKSCEPLFPLRSLQKTKTKTKPN